MKLYTKAKPALLWEFYFISIITDINVTYNSKEKVYYGSNSNIHNWILEKLSLDYRAPNTRGIKKKKNLRAKLRNT